MKKLSASLFISLLIVALLAKGYDKLVEGFYISRTLPPPIIESLYPPSPKASFDTLGKALDQPFYYLASGSQSFAFISADHQYVLKLFKHYRWKPPLYAHYFPKQMQAVTKKRFNGLLATYQSCIFCMKEFKEETALLYLQLSPSPDNPYQITLHNRLGKKYLLPLKTTSFILQKYAEPVGKHLLELKARHEEDKAKACIFSLFQHLLHERSQGFTDKDPNFLNNFGFVAEHVVSVDVGGLIKDPKKDAHYFCHHELKKAAKTFLPWLENHYPELLPYTTELIQRLKEEVSKPTPQPSL